MRGVLYLCEADGKWLLVAEAGGGDHLNPPQIRLDGLVLEESIDHGASRRGYEVGVSVIEENHAVMIPIGHIVDTLDTLTAPA